MIGRPGSHLIFAVFLVLVCGDTARADEPSEARRERIENMDAAQKEQLSQRHKQFHDDFDKQERERFRELHRDVEHDPDCDELRRVMDRYYAWLKTLSSYQLMELRKLPAQERIERIKELQQQQRSHGKGRGRFGPGRFGPGFDRVSKMSEQIDPVDKEAFLEWIAEYAARYEDAFTKNLPESSRQRLQRELSKVDDSQKRLQVLFWRMWLRRQLDDHEKPLPGIDDDWSGLLKALSPETRKALEVLPEDERHERIAGKIRDLAVAYYFARRWDSMPSVITENELADFFANDLDQRRRSWLTDLPPNETKRWMWRVYLISKLPRMYQGFPSRGSGGPGRPGASRHGPPDREDGKRPQFVPPGHPPDKRPGPGDRSRQSGAKRNASERDLRGEKPPQRP